MFKSILVVLKMFILFPFLFVYSVWDKKKNPRCKIYGIEGYFGLMGQGKTLSMTRRLMKLRKKAKSISANCSKLLKSVCPTSLGIVWSGSTSLEQKWRRIPGFYTAV